MVHFIHELEDDEFDVDELACFKGIGPMGVCNLFKEDSFENGVGLSLFLESSTSSKGGSSKVGDDDDEEEEEEEEEEDVLEDLSERGLRRIGMATSSEESTVGLARWELDDDVDDGGCSLLASGDGEEGG